jgi:YbbR domain-containing protein
MVGGEPRAFAVRDVPVLYLGADDDIALVGSPPAEVEVRVECPRGAVGRALEGNAILVDLGDATAGTRTVGLSEGDLQSLPDGCTAWITPDRLTLSLDTRVQRQVPFVETVTGTPPEGYEVGRINPRPAAVWVSGPASAFESDDVRVLSDPVDLSALDADGTSEVHVIRVGGVPSVPEMRVLNPSDFSMLVEIREKRDRITREILVAGLPDAVEADPATVTVVVEGYPSKAPAVFAGLQALVPSDGLGSEWDSRPVSLSREPADFGAELLSLRPETVRVRAATTEGASG